MARTLPLIRAAALFPMLRLLEQNPQDGDQWLASVGLEPLTESERERPVPLLKGFDLFRMLGARHGPDACARMVSPHSIQDLGVFGGLVLGASTPRDALDRIMLNLPRYSTHEVVQVKPIPGGLCFQAGWSVVLDPEMMHLTQQFTAALITFLCRATTGPTAGPRAISLRPHPEFGVDHLQQIYGVSVTASDQAVLSVDLDDSVLDAPLQFKGAAHTDGPPVDWVLPNGNGSFSESVSLALDALNTSEPVTVEEIAALAGLGTRSFQRLLTAEGTKFRLLMDSSRREKTLCAIGSASRRGSIAVGPLGFSDQSSLSRAVRRWTGLTPKNLRNGKLP